MTDIGLLNEKPLRAVLKRWYAIFLKYKTCDIL